MSTTNSIPDDAQSHGTPPTEPHTPDNPSEEQPQARNALAWTTTGLSAAFCTTGVVLSLTGHEEAGIALISAGAAGRGVSIQK
ncbi:hypothetical protein [Streptomyces sp. NPDC006012]|uniref:hypothetical protein n=1 Tax=Streptomyces sp. NPDC006012 TaxID=3364739 RepID=UPI0036926FA3